MPRKRKPARRASSSTGGSQTQGMSAPLPFGFMKGLVRIYFATWKTGKDKVKRFYVYFQELVTQRKFKQSFVEKSYIAELEKAQIPGTYNVVWQTSGKGKNKTTDLVLTPQQG